MPLYVLVFLGIAAAVASQGCCGASRGRREDTPSWRSGVKCPACVTHRTMNVAERPIHSLVIISFSLGT
jgi:hypothetical protein